MERMIRVIKQKQHTWYITAYGLILLSFFLRVFQLNNIAVEKAEMTNITWYIRDGLGVILTQNRALNNHPLNSVLGYLTSSLGYESLFTLRWHSVVIGVITIAVVFRVAEDWFKKQNGLIAGLLISISAYHVTLSQRARSYVSLVGFTLLGFYFGYRAVQTGQKRYWLGFVFVSILNIYAHLYGVMAVGVIGLLILALLINKVFTQQAARKAIISALSPLLLSLGIIYLVSFGLYLPMLPDLISVTGQNNQFRQSDIRHADQRALFEQIEQPFFETIRPFSLAEDSTRLRLGDPTFHYSPFDLIALLAEEKTGYYLALVSFLLGIIFAWRIIGWQTFIFLAWLLLPFVIQMVGNIILPGAYFRGRFLAFIYPPYLLLMACAWPGLADWLKAKVGDRPLFRTLAGSVGWVGVGVLVFFNLTWLGAFYSAAINEHWNDVAQHILQNVQPNDVIICGQRPKTACNFDLSTRTAQDVKEFATLITFDDLRENRSDIEQPGRVWVVMPHLLPWQITELEGKLAPAHYWLDGHPQYDQVGWWLIDSQQTLADNLIAALELGADLSLDEEEKYRNYISLARIHLARHQLAAAEQAFDSATEFLPRNDGLSVEWFDEAAKYFEYARQAAEPNDALPPTAVPVDLNFGDLARLVAYEIDRQNNDPAQSISPGETLQVNLYWQPLAPIKQDLVSYVHLTDLKANLIGQARGVPAAGQAPTTTWAPGQIILDSHPVVVDETIRPPLALKLEAGLFEPQNFSFIPAIDEAAQPISPLIAKMRLASATEPSIKPTYESNADFAGLISFIGYDLIPDPLGLVFYWQAQAEMDEDYTVFVHLLDAEGQLVGQMDGQPFQGDYPTSWWVPGEVIIDPRSGLTVAPGSYRLLVGWYRAADGTRLPLADGSGDSVTLGAVNIP